jgi:ATP-dependent DNA helicase RecQ
MTTSTQNPALELLKKYFGYPAFRGQQQEIIQTITSGKDCLVLMPTGGGKSVCYQIPALMTNGITLVVSPLISLMKDQVDALRSNGVEAAFMNSSLSYEQEQEIAARCFHGKLKLLYMAPEKVISSLTHFLKRLPVTLIAIDEAHCVSQWGHDFRPEYKELIRLRETFPGIPVMALTATADKLTRSDIVQLLDLKEPQQFIASFDRPNLSLSVKSGLNKKEKLRDISSFLVKHADESGIIYCTSRAATEMLSVELGQLGIKAKAYHAGLSSDERNRVQEAFIKDDIQIVCATIAFGMGIDKSNVRFVMHYNLPKSIENYYQEIGRGGRDGMPCETVLYYSIGDLMMLRSFAEASGQREINIEKLTRMQDFAEAKHCRRRILLNYFGQNKTENCGNCDVCKHPPVNIDGTVLAQKVVSALTRVQQMGESIGSFLLIDVLRGMKHAGIMEKKLHTIKTYGAGADLNARQWNFYILQMIQLGVIEIAYDKGNTLSVTSFGEHILKGGKLYLNEPVVTEYLPESRRSRTNKFIDTVVSDSGGQSEGGLFGQLRKLRKRIADEEGLPPYIIFHDSTLQDMIVKMPSNEEELLAVSGVSLTKSNKYGAAFLEVLTSGYIPSVNVNETLSEEKLIAYKNELEQKQLRFSAAVVGSVLAGDRTERYAVIGRQVSFYGILEDVVPYDEIRKRINPFYAPLEKELKENRKDQTAAKVQAQEAEMEKAAAYFNGTLINLLSESGWTEREQQIASIPFQKPTETASEAIQALRRQHFRANEPWSPEEEGILKQLLKVSNDLPRIVRIMGRSERSILVASARFLNKA